MDHAVLGSEHVGSSLNGLKTSCFTPNFMDCINLLRLLYRPVKGKTSLKRTGIEIIVRIQSQTLLYWGGQYGFFFSSEVYGINSSLCNRRIKQSVSNRLNNLFVYAFNFIGFSLDFGLAENSGDNTAFSKPVPRIS